MPVVRVCVEMEEGREEGEGEREGRSLWDAYHELERKLSETSHDV